MAKTRFIGAWGALSSARVETGPRSGGPNGYGVEIVEV